MTQKERDELQDYLNERFFVTKKQRRSDLAKLGSDQAVDSLYQVVKKIKDMTIHEIDGTELDDALLKVSRCLQEINFHSMMPNTKNSKNIVPRDKMPFLVKQVLWLICYKALQAGLKQKDVYNELEKYNIYMFRIIFLVAWN